MPFVISERNSTVLGYVKDTISSFPFSSINNESPQQNAYMIVHLMSIETIYDSFCMVSGLRITVLPECIIMSFSSFAERTNAMIKKQTNRIDVTICETNAHDNT